MDNVNIHIVKVYLISQKKTAENWELSCQLRKKNTYFPLYVAQKFFFLIFLGNLYTKKNGNRSTFAVLTIKSRFLFFLSHSVYLS